MTPALPNQPGHRSFFHPLQYETPGPVSVDQEAQDTVANKRSVSTPRDSSQVRRRSVSTLPLHTGLQGRISIPPSITGHERGHLSPYITRLKPERQTRLQYSQMDGGRTRTHSGTTTGQYNLFSLMDDSFPKLPSPPAPGLLCHMARFLRTHTCSSSLPPPSLRSLVVGLSQQQRW